MRSVPRVARRDILKAIAATTATMSFRRAWSETYHLANTDWFAACHFGISTHWTAQSQPVGKDDWLPFEEAVNRFDAKRYVQQAAKAGAEYIIFTSCHALQMLPAPCAAIDRVAPGRTTRRDLVGDLADACHARDMHFILYYNHSCNHGDDSPWEYTVGYHAPDKARLARNLLAIVRELAERYGSRVDGWWFDSCFSLDPHGVYDSVSTDLNGFQFPWEDFVGGCKGRKRAATRQPQLRHAYPFPLLLPPGLRGRRSQRPRRGAIEALYARSPAGAPLGMSRQSRLGAQPDHDPARRSAIQVRIGSRLRWLVQPQQRSGHLQRGHRSHRRVQRRIARFSARSERPPRGMSPITPSS